MKSTKSLTQNIDNSKYYKEAENKGALEHPGVDPVQIFQESPIAFYSTDAEGRISFFNEAAVKLWGRRPELGNDLWCGSWKIFYPDGTPMPLDECPMAKTLLEGTTYDNERINIERPDHSFRSLLVFPRPIFDQDGILIGAHNTLVDITDQQNNELKRATLSAIVESSDDAIISKDLNGKITSWNRGAQEIFGYREEEVLGKSITILIPEERLKEEELIIGKIRAGKKVEHFETMRKRKDGIEIAISLSISPIKDSQGNIIGASKIARNIDEQLKTKRELEKQTRNLEVLNSIGKSISSKMDVKAILQQVTDATTNLTGAAFGAFFYNTVNEHGESYKLVTLSGAPREAFEKFGMPRNTSVFNPIFVGEGIIRVDDITKDPRYGKNKPHAGIPKGHPKVASFLGVPVKSASGEVIGGLFYGHPSPGVFREEHEKIVHNIAAQAAISLDNSRLFERVQSLSKKKDEFIALASHELRTPLTTVNGYLQVLAKKETDKMSALFLKKSLQQANKLNLLVEDLLNMSRIETGKLEFQNKPFDLKELLEDIREMFRYSYKHQLVCEFGELPVRVIGDSQRIEQAVFNLLNNAVKYSPRADKVYLSLSRNESEVVVSVRDEGIGLTKEDLNRIFSRFYRAKNNNGISGLGLGLYLSKQIIEQHKGRLWVESTHGKGAEFFFSLPFSPIPK